ncbi:hypothetical protein SLS62_005025 [Diatrype stigma]|uniref:EKC/KEOPS complex subunit BUD32 n=1 Tax=Diatrype stigma TaxID=117547 RepID=A0AAN9UQE1_9PEZI
MSETSGKSSTVGQDAEKPYRYKYRNVMIMDDVEDLEDYEPGGLAPLDIGDTLGDRFQIIYKLGYGGIATIWLCWELATEKWRAVKVNAASRSSDDCPDLMAMQHMKEHGVTQEQLEANHIVMPLETFWEETPNGRHLCSVLPVLGPKLLDWRSDVLGKDVERVDTDRVDDLCYQVAEGLSFLHSKGLCHGDFRPQNILMKLKPGCLDHLSRDDMCDILGTPDSANVWTTTGGRSEHAPREVVIAAAWQRIQDFVIDEVAIVDFGEAYKANDRPKDFGIPPPYASPEVLFNKGRVGFESDVWSLAATLLEVRINRRGGDDAADAIRCYERFAGPIPPYYRSEAKQILIDHELDIADEDDQDSDSASGALQLLTGPLDLAWDWQEERDAEAKGFSHPLEMRLGAEQFAYGLEPHPQRPGRQRTMLLRYHLSRDEVLDFSDLLRQMFKYKPEERISTTQVLSHRWFKRQHASRKERRSILKNHWIGPAIIGLLAFVIWVLWNRPRGAATETPKKGEGYIPWNAIILFFFL